MWYKLHLQYFYNAHPALDATWCTVRTHHTSIKILRKIISLYFLEKRDFSILVYREIPNWRIWSGDSASHSHPGSVAQSFRCSLPGLNPQAPRHAIAIFVALNAMNNYCTSISPSGNRQVQRITGQCFSRRVSVQGRRISVILSSSVIRSDFHLAKKDFIRDNLRHCSSNHFSEYDHYAVLKK